MAEHTAISWCDNLTSEDRAYLAGLIDGDGCIRISGSGGAKKNKGKPGYCYPLVIISMTDRTALDWAASRLQTSVYVNAKRATTGNGWKPQYAISVTGSRAVDFCRVLFPYLKTKRHQAELILRFPMQGQRGPGVLLATELIVLREAIRGDMRVLNKRGPPTRE